MLSTDKSCLAESGYQPKFATVLCDWYYQLICAQQRNLLSSIFRPRLYETLMGLYHQDDGISSEERGLKTLDTIGNCQRPVFSLVYLNNA